MPVVLPGSKCGSQADKGDKNPPKGTKLSDMNTCPLNAYVIKNNILRGGGKVLTVSVAAIRNGGKWLRDCDCLEASCMRASWVLT
jgi:hypothetical protein